MSCFIRNEEGAITGAFFTADEFADLLEGDSCVSVRTESSEQDLNREAVAACGIPSGLRYLKLPVLVENRHTGEHADALVLICLTTDTAEIASELAVAAR